MPLSYPTIIPGLRGPSEEVQGLVYFGRMLDKIRLQAEGKLPEGWHGSLGSVAPMGFDARCCRFLGIDYAELSQRTLAGGSDEEILAWARERGRAVSEEELEIFNAFMIKRGWRDDGRQRLNERLDEIGLPAGTVETMFEYIDLDEGRLAL